MAELTGLADYQLSDSDWTAIDYGIRHTSSDDDQWFEYPIGHITVKAALETGADELLIVDVTGATRDEQQQIGWLGDVLWNWHLTRPSDR
jgi:hypothetical protein